MRIRHLPHVNNVAIDIDQINFATAALQCKQGKAGKRPLVIAGAQPDNLNRVAAATTYDSVVKVYNEGC